MPTYEYACRNCGHHLEVFQSFTEEPLTTCPNCEGDLRKVFGSIGIVLKGSGFYRTDSRAASGAKTAAHDTAEKKEATSGSDGASGAPQGTAGSPASASGSSSASASGATSPPASSPAAAAAS
jgi:putative FmdB family regulatory protein